MKIKSCFKETCINVPVLATRGYRFMSTYYLTWFGADKALECRILLVYAAKFLVCRILEDILHILALQVIAVRRPRVCHRSLVRSISC